MTRLIPPHGSGKLQPLLLTGAALAEGQKRALSLPQVAVSSREKGDLIMLATGCSIGHEAEKSLSEGEAVAAEFSRPEVLDILREYCAGLKQEDKVEVKLSGHSAR